MGEVKTPELKGNSNKSKIVTKEGEQKLKPVVKGEVTKKQKSFGRKFADSFFGADVTNVKDYLVYDIIIPSMKDGILDAVTNGLSMLLNGSKAPSRSGKKTYNGGGTNYNKVYTINQTPYGSSSRMGGMGPRDSRYSGRGGLQEDIILGMRAEAEEVLESLVCACEEYGCVSVGELYDLLGQSSAYTDRNWGWYDLSSARVVRVPEGYLLRLPRCISLK